VGRLGAVLRFLLFAVLLVILTRAFFFSTFVVQGDSMQHTLGNGDHVLVNHFIYHLRPPERGDIVILNCPMGDEVLVKRVIAEPGEIVEIEDGVVYINGAALSEPYLSGSGDSHLEPVKVGAAEVFVMGDNRRDSSDSRDFGPIARSKIQGKFLLVFWPLPQVLDWN